MPVSGHTVVVMGVSGSGKSTLGPALADALGVGYVEGDTLHSAANVAKMAAGIALDDADRQPFLSEVARVLTTRRSTGVVVSCSALKRSYRDLIRAEAGEVSFVLPALDRDALLSRLAGRRDHFMPPSLLESQIADFELPGADEGVIFVDGAAATRMQVAQVLAALRG